MKKFWSLFLAAVFVAAGVVPAMAGSIDLSGETRVRYQGDTNYSDFNDDVGDKNSDIFQRTRVNAKAKVDDQTTAFISLQDTRTWGEEPNSAETASENAAVDVSQAWLQIDNLGPVSLKLGRQPISYGKERLLGAFEWSNNARRFDAAKVIYKSEVADVDAFYATTTDSDPNTDGSLSGVYSTLKSVPATKIDLYLIQKKKMDNAGQNFITYGTRIYGKQMSLDWDVLYALQSGDSSAGVDKDASALVAAAGYSVMGVRIGGEYVVGSGDDSGADDKAFDNLYPTNHFKYGVSDIGGNGINKEGQKLSNLSAYSINATAKISKVKLRAEFWDFSYSEDQTVGTLTSDDMGSEYNIQAWYGLTEKVKLHAEYSVFSPGEIPKANSGQSADATRFVLQAHAKF